MFINYAHRGASAYAPENTMSAFRLGVEMGANGIETDIRKTKDGIPVLFHDANLLRLAGVDKPIAALTYTELSGVRINAPDGASSDTIPTLGEFLAFVKNTTVAIALEIKAEGLEEDVIGALAAFGVSDRCVVTSFHLHHLEKIKALDPAQKIGLLTDTVNDAVLSELKCIGAEQICPKADVLSAELVRSLHAAGFSVRAWGVRDEETMKDAYRCGVDGMTVNFPDRLRLYLCQHGSPDDAAQNRGSSAY